MHTYDFLRFLPSLGLTTLLLSGPPAFAEFKKPENINIALSTLFKKSELISTLGAIKPISTLECPFCSTVYHDLERISESEHPRVRERNARHREEIKAFYDYLMQAQNSGELDNPEIKFILLAENEGERANIATLNTLAMARLLQDRDAMKLIFDHVGYEPASVPEAVELFKKAAYARGFNTGPTWSQVVVGVMLGFPSKDVALYADGKTTERFPHPEGGFGFGPRDSEIYLGSFSSRTLENVNEKITLYEAGRNLLNRISTLKRSGKSSSQIFRLLRSAR